MRMKRIATTAAAALLALATRARADNLPVFAIWPDDTFHGKSVGGPDDGRPGDAFYDADDVIRPRKNDPNGIDLTAVKTPTLRYFSSAANGTLPARPSPAVIVCPGGGYAFESVTYEGDRVAEKLAKHGIAAFVLRYRLPDGHAPAAGVLPVPQQDVLRAVQFVRAHAADWQIDPARVGVMGFSAGGHLAATAATLYDDAPVLADKAGHDAASKVSARPDFAVLGYPVITMDPAKSHSGSRKNLLGPNPDKAVQDRFSVEDRVTKATPPLFVFHAEDDKTVPVANAHFVADAAQKAGVPCELMLLKKGGHGFGLGRPDAETGQWFDRMLAWMKSRKLAE